MKNVNETGEFVAILTLVLLATILLFSSPTAGDFWWFDAPSHAMNGAFIHDLVAAFPSRDPMGWAIDYYLRYPAVSVLFYPPLFPTVEAIFFAIFGVSPFVAQLTVCTFAALLSVAVYLSVRFYASRTESFSAAVLTLGVPGMALWERQVMLEIPAWCCAAWGLYFLLRYVRTGKPLAMFLCAVFLVAAIYTKQTFAFVPVAAAISLILICGVRVLRRWEVWAAAVLAAVLLLPLAVITLHYGKMNMDLASGAVDSSGGIWSLHGLFWYAADLPRQAGWFVLCMAAGFLLCSLTSAQRRGNPLFILFGITFLTGYCLLTAIALKDGRYTTQLLVPCAVFASLAAACVIRGRWRNWIICGGALTVFAFSLLTQPVPFVAGQNQAAAEVAREAPANTNVLIYGQRTASFIFDFRAGSNRPDMRVLRAEKFLVHYRQGRAGGVQALAISKDDIRAYFNRYRISYVVFENGFWTDLTSVQQLQQVLREPQFEHVRTIHVAANVPHNDRELEVFRYKGAMLDRMAPLDIDMPMIGRRFSNAKHGGS